MPINFQVSTPFDLDPKALNELEELLSSFHANREQTLTGQLIRGRFLSATEREYFFDIGEKEEGICLANEFEKLPALGEVVSFAVIRWKGDGCAILSKKEGDRLKAWGNLKEAFEANVTLSVKVSRLLPSGYLVDFESLELFMPYSHSSLNSGGSANLKIGSILDVRILELKERYYSAIVSHRSVLEERNEALWDQFLKEYKQDDIIEGVVVKRVSFGIFLEVNGLIGLLHHNDISWKKWGSFKDKFPIKTKIQVKIIELDKENNRLRLGLKQLTRDPWEVAQESIVKDEIVTGKVVSIVSFGAFVEINEGVEGLLHLNEMTYDRKKKHPNAYVQVGQELQLKVLTVEYENRRLNLSLKELLPDPWKEFCLKNKIGDVLTGRVRNITDFGTFVSISDGIEGLIFTKDYSWDERVEKNYFKKGQELQFKILTIDNESQKVSCGVKQLYDSPLKLFQKKYSNSKEITAKIKKIATFGLIVELEGRQEGMVPMSEIRLEDGDKIENLYKIGDEIKVLLKDIDFAKRRIYLSLRAYMNKLNYESSKQYFHDKTPLTSTPFAEALEKLKAKS